VGEGVMTRLGLSINEANLAEKCPAGTLRLPGLLVRATPLQSERHVVPEREPVQEGRAALKDESRQSPGAGQRRSVAGRSERAEQALVRLVELLPLRDAPLGIPCC
jgi:hypothetical protein